MFDCSECGILFETEEDMKNHHETNHRIKTEDDAINKFTLKNKEEETKKNLDDNNDETDEESDADEGEVKDKLFNDRYYGGESNDEPGGSSVKFLKGKKGDFLNAFNSLKEIMVPGTKHSIGNKTIIIKNEVISNGKSIFRAEVKVKNKVGEANVTFHGPNKNSECTIQVTKAKKVEGFFVKVVTETFIKNLLTDSMNGKGWSDLKSEKNWFSCKDCTKKYISEKNLLTHITKTHNVDTELMCAICNTVYKTKGNLSRHMDKYHTKKEVQTSIKEKIQTRLYPQTKKSCSSENGTNVRGSKNSKVIGPETSNEKDLNIIQKQTINYGEVSKKFRRNIIFKN